MLYMTARKEVPAVEWQLAYHFLARLLGNL